MNLDLRDIVKEEVQKLLDAAFIYPISDSQWVSQLVLVPKKDGRWRICIDYQELNKDTLKDYFPLPFIDQEALENLEKVILRCQEAHLALSDKKCRLMCKSGVVLCHLISSKGFQVDPTKIEIILHLPAPKTQREEFNITIVDRPGESNVVADFLSRLDNPGEATPVNDDFPDEHLFAMSTDSLWFADIANFLVTGKTPPHLAAREKQSIVQKSAAYFWIQGDLFYIGLDLIIRRCVREEKVVDILKSAHDEPCGGHFADK
eukprot:PITA_11204